LLRHSFDLIILPKINGHFKGKLKKIIFLVVEVLFLVVIVCRPPHKPCDELERRRRYFELLQSTQNLKTRSYPKR
jgi:hypothetical protein